MIGYLNHQSSLPCFGDRLWPQPIQAIADPASVFLPHLERLQHQLPLDYALRLAAKILLGDPVWLQRNSIA